MKTLLKLFLVVIVLGGEFASAQVISEKSDAVKFDMNNLNKKVFATSESMTFTAAPSLKISAVSPMLSFGTIVAAKPETPVQPAKVIPEKKEGVASSTVQPKKDAPVTDRKVEESKPTKPESIVKTHGAELGDEYKNRIPDYYALIIGVSDYKYNGQGIQSLDNPLRDAEQLYSVLTSQYSFEKEKVKFLKNASRQQIIDAFENLSTELDDKDNLLVFYAGHGFYDKTKQFGFWLPSDARTSSRSDWIPNSTVKDYLSAIKSKHTLLITDACFGGSIFKTRSVDDYQILKIHEMYKSASRKAITSGNLSEVPDQSIFLAQLIKKLSENTDDYLPAQKLFSRIYEPVTNNSSADPKFGVIQGSGDEGGDFIFIRRQK